MKTGVFVCTLLEDCIISFLLPTILNLPFDAVRNAQGGNRQPFSSPITCRNNTSPQPLTKFIIILSIIIASYLALRHDHRRPLQLQRLRHHAQLLRVGCRGASACLPTTAVRFASSQRPVKPYLPWLSEERMSSGQARPAAAATFAKLLGRSIAKAVPQQSPWHMVLNSAMALLADWRLCDVLGRALGRAGEARERDHGRVQEIR